MQTSSTTLPTLALTATELHYLIEPVLPHASTDGTYGLLTSVRVTVRDGWVIAAATDRYRLAYHRIRPSEAAPEGFAAVIPTAALRRIRQIFRPGRRYDPALLLTVDSGVLTVQSSTGGRGLAGATFLTFDLPYAIATYPPLDRLLRYAIEHPVDTAEVAHVDPRLLDGFTQGWPRLIPLSITAVTGASGSRQWLIRREDGFIGVLMQTREAGGPEDTDTVSWIDLLDAPDDSTGGAR